MPHVSKKKIESEKMRVFLNSLYRSIVKIPNEKEAKKFWQALFSETEEVMLAKRLAAIYMIFDEKSEYEIEKNLGISSSTAARIHKNVKTGSYDYLINMFERNSEPE